jgi:DNA-binding IscR family transcriptional regulator
MNDNYQLVLEKDRKRFEVLRFVYIDTDGRDDQASSITEIGHATGISDEELIQILVYLKNEGLIKVLGSIYGGGSTAIQILHQGICEIEAAIKKPNESTEHFPMQVFNITNNSSVGGQQFGNNNTLNINQRNLTEVASEIQQLLKQLEQDYPTGTLTEKAFVAEEAIRKIEDDPTLKARFVGTLKSAGKEAFKEAIDHPLVNILMAGIDGWQEGS